MKKKITVSEVNKKRVRIVIYLVVSGGLGLLLAYVAKNPVLAAIFAPAINFILFSFVEELKGEGYRAALKAK